MTELIDVKISSSSPRSADQAGHPPVRRVRVIGAGFSGLAMAYYLERAGYRVDIFESANRIGGLIGTQQTPDGRVETAANGLLNSQLVSELFADLEVPLKGTMPLARRRFIFRWGRANRWPLSVLESVRVLILILRLIFNRKSVRPQSFESVAHWGRRLLGESASRHSIETVLQGIYAGNSDKMSASLIFGRWFKSRAPAPRAPARPASANRQKAKKPVIRGTVAPSQGMQSLIDSFEIKLRGRGVVFHLGTSVTPEQIENWAREAPVVLATNAPAAARLLGEMDKRYAALKSVEILPLVTATVFFESPLGLQGFGCLFPPIADSQVLGVLFNNYTFEGAVQRFFSETWMLGGARDLSSNGISILDRTDQEILNLIEKVRAGKFKVASRVMSFTITRWPEALPHYTVGLESLVPVLEPMSQNILLMGNYLGQIGLGKILERAVGAVGQLAAATENAEIERREQNRDAGSKTGQE